MLTTPVSRSRAKKVDCGRFGVLTVNQIAAIAGMSREGVWQRIRAGVTGKALCEPKYDGTRRTREPCRRPVVLVAMKLARKFPDRVPSLGEIQRAHPMGKRNAQRWRQALVESMEVSNG